MKVRIATINLGRLDGPVITTHLGPCLMKVDTDNI